MADVLGTVITSAGALSLWLVSGLLLSSSVRNKALLNSVIDSSESRYQPIRVIKYNMKSFQLVPSDSNIRSLNLTQNQWRCCCCPPFIRIALEFRWPWLSQCSLWNNCSLCRPEDVMTITDEKHCRTLQTTFSLDIILKCFLSIAIVSDLNLKLLHF